MKVCFVVVEIFAHGHFGGFGSLTRTLGKELVKRGVEVFVVTPRRGNQGRRETLDGIKVLTYPRTNWRKSIECIQECDCDIYHSVEPSMGTVYAQKVMPDRIHLITFQDPRIMHDWWTEFKYHTPMEKLAFFSYMFFELNSKVKKAVRNSTRCYTQAKFVAEKARRLYRLNYTPAFLPNPTVVPDRIFEKPKSPTVLFLGRWDPVKRVNIFCELARHFPYVQFTALGKASNSNYDEKLRKKYSNIPNLKMPGFINQFLDKNALSDYLGNSWILCNTSAKECLPVSFLEAAAHQCAILSHIDPDCFGSQMGYHAKDDDFANGLKWLLQNDNWKKQGMNGYRYVKENHELNHVVNLHLEIYEDHLMKK